MILTIDVTATDAAGNVSTGSVAVTVNLPAATAAPSPSAPAAAEVPDFIRRSLMLARGWSSR